MRGLRYGLTEEGRYAIADDVVLQLKRYGDVWHHADAAADRKPVAGLLGDRSREGVEAS